MEDERHALLILESEMMQQGIFRRMCTEYGYQPTIASSGTRGLSLLRGSNIEFEAILISMPLPDMDSLGCAQQMRTIEAAVGRRTPIIAVAAEENSAAEEKSGVHEKCLGAGINGFMSKPFTMEQFRSILLTWAYDPKHPNLKLLPKSA